MGKTTKIKVAKTKSTNITTNSQATPNQITIVDFLTGSPAKQKEFFDLIDDVVKNRSSIHIQAPTGSGKNVLALRYIEAKKTQNVVYVVPQISIGTQFINDLAELAVPIQAYELNHETIKDGVGINLLQDKNRKVVLSTLDSLREVSQSQWFIKDTLIFLDETHTAIQNFRENFPDGIDALRDKPIVGFSATPSLFVNDRIINIKKKIEVILKTPRTVTIEPYFALKNLNKCVALECLHSAKKGLVIVFLNEKKQMEKIQEEILAINPNIKVEIFNKDTKDRAAWKYLMDKGEIQSTINVVLINSVANAGVNIKNLNTDIEEVILAGTFDIFGFYQYLGRPRNYTKNFTYFFDGQGDDPESFNYEKVQLATSIAKEIGELLHKARMAGIKFFDGKMD